MFSRKMATAAALIALLVLFAVIVSVSARRPAAAPAGVARIVLAAVSPLQEASFRVAFFFVSIWETYFDLVSAGRENVRLSRELAGTRAALFRARAAEGENRRFRALLSLGEDLPYTTLAARVVGEGPSQWFKSLVIDRGSRDGVLPGFPVVTPGGVVGRVLEVSGHYSLVVPIADPNHAVDGRIERTRARGVVAGSGEAGCRFLYVTRKEDIRVGDTVVTTGLDRLFPPGLPLGRVTHVSMMGESMFQEIAVTPWVDFDKVEEVVVIFSALALPSWGPS